MSKSPDEIRANIESTREELSSDVDALTDKVSPSQIAHRNTERLKDAAGSVRDRVMGVASDAKAKAGEMKDRVADMSESATDAAGRQAQGNPLAVGLIAFGIGWLAASLMPATRKEQELAATAKDKAQPLIQDVAEQAKASMENLKEPAKEAAQSVKDTAVDAAQEVRSDAQDAGEQLREQARDGVEETRHTLPGQ